MHCLLALILCIYLCIYIYICIYIDECWYTCINGKSANHQNSQLEISKQPQQPLFLFHYHIFIRKFEEFCLQSLLLALNSLLWNMLLSKNSIPFTLNTCMWFAILYMNVPSIHTSDFLGFGLIEQAEGIPSNSCRTGFCHIQCSCHGNCCICCISPSFENIYIYRTYINILYLKYFFSCHIKNMHSYEMPIIIALI